MLCPLLFLLTAQVATVIAQETRDSLPPYRVDLSVCGGYSVRLVGDKRRITGLGYSFGGGAGTVRLMWQPEHRLSVGIEGGFFPVTTIVSDTGAEAGEAELALSAVPVFAMMTMRFGGLEALGGIGVYSYAVDGTSIKRFGFAASSLEIGYTLGAAYTYDLSSRIGIGGELRLYQFTDRPIAIVMPAVRLRFSIVEY